MKWQAQVVHVARKDLRLAGWLILAYVAVVAGSTVGAADRAALPGAESPFLMFGLVLLGMILFAILVQADSPARSDAFWASRPLYPSAVFSAKILLAFLLLLGVPLVGQVIALLGHDVTPKDLLRMVGDSALSYGSWLLMAAVIAALTRDLRTFLVALVLVTLSWFIGMQVIGFLLNPSMTPGPPSPLLVPVVLLAGMLALLARQYLTRSIRRGVWVAGLLAVASLLLPLVVPRSAWSVVPASGKVPDNLRLVRVSIQDVQLGEGTEAQLQLRLEGISAAHQYMLVSPVVHLHLPDGSVISHAAKNAPVGLSMPDRHLAAEFRWLGNRQAPDVYTQGLSIDLSQAQAAALSRGGARLALQGYVEVREPRAVADLPLDPGATVARDGRRVRIVEVEKTAADPSLKLRISAVSPSRSADPEQPISGLRWESPFAYALVNREQKEALALDSRESRGSSFGLVLPGPRTFTETTQLRRAQPIPWDENSWAQVNEEWLQQARLLLVRWVPVGSYPVTIETQSPVVRAFAGSAGPRVRAAPRREPAAGQ